eukprot:TRINITY_DN3467_c0_g5_i1.p1 TRINITY_DN3467_c0_g5~~TRINITY_DN3467_c0_g5_i1.p1  ORF type:complete len:226 (+),score=72.61 TRINITY_DN3467_c0_g5_i1:67-678(+)
MAALTSAFTKSSTNKGAPKPRSPIVNKSSQRAAAVAALSSVLSAEAKGNVPPAPPAPKRSGAVAKSSTKAEPSISAESGTDPGTKNETESTVASETEEVSKTEELRSEEGGNTEEVSQGVDEEVCSNDTEDADKTTDDTSSAIYSYEQLKARSTNPAPGIDPKKRETYLSEEEFQKIFRMDRDKFYEQPKWKQDLQKRAVDMF